MSKRDAGDLWDLDKLFRLPDLFGGLGRRGREAGLGRLPGVFGERPAPDLPRLDLERPTARREAMDPLPTVLTDRAVTVANAREPGPEDGAALDITERIDTEPENEKAGPDWVTGLLSVFGWADHRAEDAEAAVDAARRAAGAGPG